MKARGHDEGGKQHSPKTGQVAGNADAQAHDQDGQGRGAVLGQHQEQVDHQQGQKAGNLPHGLGNAHLKGTQAGAFHGKVAEQGHPAHHADGGGDGGDHEEPVHALLRGSHAKRPGRKREYGSSPLSPCELRAQRICAWQALPRKVPLSRQAKTARRPASTKPAARPAARSSAITPQPPGRRCREAMGPGFTISKKRNRANPVSSHHQPRLGNTA